MNKREYMVYTAAEGWVPSDLPVMKLLMDAIKGDDEAMLALIAWPATSLTEEGGGR